MPNTGIQGISLTAKELPRIWKSMFVFIFLLPCSFHNCEANFYFLEGALDALLCGNSSDAG